jgi:beta-galactosidase
VLVGSDGLFYLGAWLDEDGFDRVIQMFVTPQKMPAGVRIRDTNTHRFWFNYNPHSVTVDENEIKAAGVTWRKL